MKIRFDLEFDQKLRRALRYRWGKQEGLATKSEIEEWLLEMLDRTFEKVLDGAYSAGVIDSAD